MKKAISVVFILLLAGGLVYAFRVSLENFLARIENQYLPCARPITYTIGSFDARFGISKADFLGAIKQAEQIWEKPVAKELFTNAPDGNLQINKFVSPRLEMDEPVSRGLGMDEPVSRGLEINLIYDSRQEATATLRKLGLVVRDDKASYNSLKSNYAALEGDYTKEKALFDSRVAALEKHKQTYETEVSYWNKRGGAPHDVYDRLNGEKISLDSEVAEIDRLQADINAKVSDINALAIVLNRLAASLNIEVAKFNQVGRINGGEFEEGTFQSGPSGEEINIYQFDDTRKLIRVLAHELGHALGLAHVSNPKAIMYRLNSGANEKLTADDIEALKNRCGIH